MATPNVDENTMRKDCKHRQKIYFSDLCVQSYYSGNNVVEDRCKHLKYCKGSQYLFPPKVYHLTRWEKIKCFFGFHSKTDTICESDDSHYVVYVKKKCRRCGCKWVIDFYLPLQ